MLSKKRVLAICMATSLTALICSNAQAVDSGTITFNGLILADSCAIDVNDSGSSTATVKMPGTYITDYTGPDTVGAEQSFTIKVSGCDILANQIALNFAGTTDARGAANEVLQTTGTATNVGIRLADTTGGRSTADGKIVFNTANAFWQDNNNKLATPTENVFNYTAQTVQVGDDAPTTGTYAATATFKVAYQ